MNNLIPISNTNNRITVLGRDLHKFLEITERYSSWFERMLQYGFIENVDYLGCKTFNALAKQELQDHQLTIEMSKEIAMIQRSDKGKQARLYFLECEKQLQLKLPTTYKEALIALVASEEEKEKLEKEKQIADKRAFSSMGRLSGEVRKNISLEKQLGLVKGYKTILAYKRETGVDVDWGKLKEYCLEHDLEIKEVADVRYGTVKSYPITAFEVVYGKRKGVDLFGNI